MVSEFGLSITVIRISGPGGIGKVEDKWCRRSCVAAKERLPKLFALADQDPPSTLLIERNKGEQLGRTHWVFVKSKVDKGCSIGNFWEGNVIELCTSCIHAERGAVNPIISRFLAA